MVNALLVTLHDPIRLAEQVATLDLTSGGRFTFVAGLGYRPEEFEMAGVDQRRRGAIVEEYLEVLRAAWTGEPFQWQGRTIVVTPTPTSPPDQLVWAGGSVRASAARAARLRLPFFSMSTDPTLGDIYREECEKVGYHEGFFMFPNGPSFVHVAEDPEQAWDAIGDYAVYDATSYRSWQHGARHDNAGRGGRCPPSTISGRPGCGKSSRRTNASRSPAETARWCSIPSWEGSPRRSGGRACSSTSTRCSPRSEASA